MPRVTRRSEARSDLAAIWDYISDSSPQRATVFLREIESLFETLAEQPEMGRERSDLMDDLRSFPIGRYIVFYLPWSDGIDVLRVLHAARNIKREFGER